MAAVVIVLLLLALVFGVGAVLEGVFWVLVISAALLVAAAWLGYTKLRDVTRG